MPLQGYYAPDVYVSVLAVRGRVAGWRLWLADFARRWHLPFFQDLAAKPTALVDLAKPSFRLGIAKIKVGWDAHRLAVDVTADRDEDAALCEQRVRQIRLARADKLAPVPGSVGHMPQILIRQRSCDHTTRATPNPPHRPLPPMRVLVALAALGRVVAYISGVPYAPDAQRRDGSRKIRSVDKNCGALARYAQVVGYLGQGHDSHARTLRRHR